MGRCVRILVACVAGAALVTGCDTPADSDREARQSAAAKARARAEAARRIVEQDLTGDPATATDAQLAAELRRNLARATDGVPPAKGAVARALSGCVTRPGSR